MQFADVICLKDLPGDQNDLIGIQLNKPTAHYVGFEITHTYTQIAGFEVNPNN